MSQNVINYGQHFQERSRPIRLNNIHPENDKFVSDDSNAGLYDR